MGDAERPHFWKMTAKDGLAGVCRRPYGHHGECLIEAPNLAERLAYALDIEDPEWISAIASEAVAAIDRITVERDQARAQRDPRYKGRPVADDECGSVDHPDGSWHYWQDPAPWWRPILRLRQRHREAQWGCQCPRDRSVVHRD